MFAMLPAFSANTVTDPVYSMLSDGFLRGWTDMDEVSGNSFRSEIREDAGEYVLEAELPGISGDQISLQLNEHILTIAADPDRNGRRQDGMRLCAERRRGHTERTFRLEGVREDGITASCANGLLTVHLPKERTEEGKGPGTIAVRRAGE